MGSAGVVNKYIELAEILKYFSYHISALGVIGNVCFINSAFYAKGFNFSLCLIGFFFRVGIVYAYICTLFGKPESHTFAYSCAASGDKGNFSFNIHSAYLLSVVVSVKFPYIIVS